MRRRVLEDCHLFSFAKLRPANESLPLESDTNILLSQRHAIHGLPRSDSTSLVLVLGESQTLATRHNTHFLEAREALEDSCESLLAIVFWQLAKQQNLVGWKVLVLVRAAWARLRSLCRPLGERLCCGAFRWLGLCFRGFDGLLAFWSNVSICCTAERAVLR